MNNPLSWTEVVKPANPAVGSGLTYLITSRAYQMVKMITAVFTASAVVASRFPVVRILDGDSDLLGEFPQPVTVVASEAYTLTWAQVGEDVQVSGLTRGVGVLPQLLLPPGFRVQVTAVNTDAGDQFSALRIWTEFHPTGDLGVATGARPYEAP